MMIEQSQLDVSWQGCNSEYDTLQQVIVCEPKFMKIKEVINEVQQKYAEQNIDIWKAMKQHQNFTDELMNHGVEVIRLSCDASFPEQVFTRDIGFTVGNRVFISEMASSIRSGEEEILQRWMERRGYPAQKISLGSIEGGDVIVDRDRLFVGVSGRTNEQAIDALEAQLPDTTVIRVPFDKKYLHLDCVFNILSPTHALIFKQALSEDVYKELATLFTLIDVDEEEQFTMGTNVLSIGHGKVFSLPTNTNINEKMRQAGYRVIEVDFSEIIKSGGSFRCCTMPLSRN